MRGPCAKRRVICAITTRSGSVYDGENDCANPQPACPRRPGEDYTKCKSVCQQADHAELAALVKAQGDGADLYEAKAVIFGHHWICEPCGKALMDAGVSRITLAAGSLPWE